MVLEPGSSKLCMKPKLHRYYNRSNVRREIASARKSGRLAMGEQSKRVAQEEDRRQWMEEPQIVGPSKYEREAHEASRSTRKWSATPNRGSTLERKFNELISTIHSMTDACTQCRGRCRGIGAKMRILKREKPPNRITRRI